MAWDWASPVGDTSPRSPAPSPGVLPLPEEWGAEWGCRTAPTDHPDSSCAWGDGGPLEQAHCCPQWDLGCALFLAERDDSGAWRWDSVLVCSITLTEPPALCWSEPCA